MASACSQEEKSFTCPVCLELLSDPVTILCGHNFCMRCIKGCWDQEDLKGEYSCPVCKHTFSSRPVLHKNPLITEMVDKFKKTSLQAPAHCYAEPEHVDCDFCIGRKSTAVKSCLDCLKSYCDTHLRTHNERVGRPHTMIDPSAQLQERICPRHNKVMDIFCRSDQSCICYLCTMDDHEGHDTVLAAAEWGLKKEGLAQKQHRCQQIIQLKEKELQEQRKAVETLKTAEEDSGKLLAEMEQEIAELKRTDAEMKQLAMTQDPIYFLKNIVSIPDDAYNTVWTRKTFRFFEAMQKSVSALNRQLEEKLDLIVKVGEDHDIPVRKADSKERLPPKMSDDEGHIAEPVTKDLLHRSRYERQHTALDRNRSTPLWSGTPPVYLLNMKPAAGEYRKEFGEASCSKRSNKTIMLVGATGSGKTALINAMTNYILGVDWKDNWRFKLIHEETNKTQAESQTSEVTAYQIHHTAEFRVPYSLTIIDTPGFGNTTGIRQDKEITERIRQFFTNNNGIDTIDAVCFVVQSDLARLTHTQKYVFEAILSVFGKNVASNIIPLVTFADGKTPPVLEAIKIVNIPCATQKNGIPVHFKFNNSALFANNVKDEDGEDSSDEDKEESFDYMFWEMGMANMKRFFTCLGTMETQSLTLTKQVLQERKQLGATVERVQPLIRKGLSTMEEIRTTQTILDQHNTQIQANKDFEYEVEVEKADRIEIPTGRYVTNCNKCQYTCHFPCPYPNDADKIHCAAMRNGYCTVCPGKCVWSVHHNMRYRWEIKRVVEKRTYQDLKRKYEEALGAKMNTENIVAMLEEEYQQVKGMVVEMMETVTTSLQRLKEIALRPDPLSTPDYIDLMIKSEKQEAKPGYKERMKWLQKVREGAVLVQNVSEQITLRQETSLLRMMKNKAVFNDFLRHFK